MSDSGQERTREPTPRRRQLARQEGHVARSRDLVAAFVCLAAMGALLVNGPLLLRGISQLLSENLSHVPIRADDVDYQVESWRRTGLIVLCTLGPWLVSVCLAACVIQWIQGGWLWVPQKLIPDLQRITPARNLLRLIEPAQLMRLLFLVLKLVGVLLLAGWLLWKNLPSIATLGDLNAAEMLHVAGPLLIRMALWISIGLLLLGGIDYAWQRWKYERALCMTPDDWRDDIKSVHNDVSSLRRRRAFQKPDDVE